MAKIQFYRQRITPQVIAPDVRGLARIESPLAQVAGAVGEAAQIIGREMTKRREDEAAVDASARAISIKSQWLTQSQELEAEALEKGELDGYTDRALAAYQDLVAKEIQQAKSPRAQAWLQEQSANFGLNVQQNSMRWEATAKVNRELNLNAESLDQARQIVNAQPENYAATRDDLALQYARLLRLDPERGTQAWRNARDSLAYDAALGALEANPNAVNEALEKEPKKSGIPYIDDLGADERLQLQAKTEVKLKEIKREQERQQAIFRDEVRGRVSDQQAAASVGQDPGPMISRAEFKAAGLTEEDYSSYRADWQLYPLMNEVSGMPRQEAIARLEKLKPTKVEGATEGVRRYNTALRNYENILRQQEDDPAAFLMQNSQIARDAYAAIGAAQTVEDRRRASEQFATIISIEAKRIGIQNEAVLPKNLANDLINRSFSKVGKDGIVVGAAAILDAKNQWGARWPDVFRQVASKLPTDAAVIGAGMSEGAANRLIEISGSTNEDLNKLLPEDVSPSSLRNLVNNALESLSMSYKGQSGDLKTMSMLQGAAYRLAASYLSTNSKISPTDAATSAANEVGLNRYEFTNINDAVVRIPLFDPTTKRSIGVSTYQLRTGLNALTRNVTKEIGDQLVRGSYWQTDPSDLGVVLMKDNSPVLRDDGSFVRYTWQTIKNVSATIDEEIRALDAAVLAGEVELADTELAGRFQ